MKLSIDNEDLKLISGSNVPDTTRIGKDSNDSMINTVRILDTRWPGYVGCLVGHHNQN